MTTICDDLRKAVLQAAIQGKLTQQLPEDGNAEDLCKEIQKEKQKLIKEGKIKKEKLLPEITEDDVPFDIPENWKWVYLGDVFSHNTGKALNQSNTEGTLFSYITTSNLYWDGFVLDNLRSMKFTESEMDKCTIRKGDLLVCEGGDIGRSAIWPYDYEMRIQNHIHKLRAYVDVCTKYYWYVLYLYKLSELIGGKGIGIQGLSSNALHKLIIPLPPLAEQKRIVACVDELMKRIDEMEKTEKDITSLYEEFPGDMKVSLLQAAIQGKLTEQRASDGDAETLYAEIQKEKQRLIKEGKLKKEKPLPDITEDDIPFDIPESWKWVRLGSLLTIISGVSYDKHDVSNSGLRIIRGGNVQNMEIKPEADDVFLPESYFDANKEIKKDDFVIVASTGSKTVIGKAGFAESDMPNTMIGAFLRICRPIFLPCVSYLYHIFSSEFYRTHIREEVQGTNINNVKESYITHFVIPLPPLSEQKRIVEKLNQLLPLCDVVKAEILEGEGA